MVKPLDGGSTDQNDPDRQSRRYCTRVIFIAFGVCAIDLAQLCVELMWIPATPTLLDRLGTTAAAAAHSEKHARVRHRTDDGGVSA